MLSTPISRRLVAPLLLTGLMTCTTLAAAPASAASVQPEPVGVPVAAALAPKYRVVPGVELTAKPPPWVLPVADYHLTGRFGASSSLWSSVHTGLDFAAVEGAAIRSVGPGVVTETSSDGAFGNRTVVRLDDGTVLWYCHQNAFAAEPGQRLSPGDLIGYVGSTGNVTGPHLHLEVRPGDKDPVDPDPIDPEEWLPEHGLHA